MSITRVALDVMGGDHSPSEMVLGAINAIKEKEDIHITLVGPEEKIKEELEKCACHDERIKILHAPDEITCHDSPVNAIRQKKEASMVMGLKLVKEGKAEGFISAGNSGALLVGGQFIVGRAKGIERTPLAPILPTTKGVSLLIDCGANVDARPSHLVQFAQMGSIYMEHVVGIKEPRVAIINIGAEEEKGNSWVKETYPLLKACEAIHFIGSIESREIPYGGADVIVTEAFVGNVILKLMEGVSGALMKEVKAGMTATPIAGFGALLAKKQLKKTLKKFDASEYGGAPLLGLNGLVVKIHGNATNKEVKNAIFQVGTFHQQDINGKIKERLLSLTTSLN